MNTYKNMQTKKKKIPNLKLSNWNKRSDRDWKLIADIMLYALPLINGVIVTMPVEDTVHKWSLVVTNSAIVFAKTVSKFTTESEDNGEIPDTK